LYLNRQDKASEFRIFFEVFEIFPTVHCTFQELDERLSKSFANYAIFHLIRVFNAVLLEKQRTTLINRH